MLPISSMYAKEVEEELETAGGEAGATDREVAIGRAFALATLLVGRGGEGGQRVGQGGLGSAGAVHPCHPHPGHSPRSLRHGMRLSWWVCVVLPPQ